MPISEETICFIDHVGLLEFATLPGPHAPAKGYHLTLNLGGELALSTSFQNDAFDFLKFVGRKIPKREMQQFSIVASRNKRGHATKILQPGRNIPLHEILQATSNILVRNDDYVAGASKLLDDVTPRSANQEQNAIRVTSALQKKGT